MSLVTKTTPSNDPFFSDLAALMRTSEFQQFYKTHMATHLDMRSSLVYIELWNKIDELFRQHTGGASLSDQDMEMVLRETFRRKEYRRPLIALIQTYLDKGMSRQTLDAAMASFFQLHLPAIEGQLSLENEQSKKI